MLRPVVRAAHIRQAGEGATCCCRTGTARSARVTQSRRRQLLHQRRSTECSAALLFKGSRCGLTARRTTPRPAYNVTGPPYAESVDVYTINLNVHDGLERFRDVPLPWRCRRSESRAGRSTPATPGTGYAVRRCPGMDHEQSALDV